MGYAPGSLGRAGRMILLAALTARIAVFIYAEFAPSRFDYPDSRRYVRVARNIAAGLGPIDSPELKSGTDPLYPAMLSIGIRFGAESDAAIMRVGRCINLVVGTLSVWMLMLLALSLADLRTALIAGTILALDPILLFFHGLILTEISTIPLLLVAVIGISRTAGSRGFIWALAAGLGLGLAALMRSSTAPLIVLLAPICWGYSGGPLSRRATRTFGMLAAAAVCLSPILVRNYKLFGAVTISRTGSGVSLLEGLGPWADGGPGIERIDFPRLTGELNERECDSIYRTTAIQWACEHPGETLRLAGRKFMRTWSPAIHAPGYEASVYQVMGWLTAGPEIALALLGAWFLRRRIGTLLLLLGPAAYLTLVHMVFVGSVRYRVPVMPLLFVLAGAGVERVWRRVGQRLAA